MKNCFAVDKTTVPAIDDIINVDVMMAWVRGYGTDDEKAKLRLLASEAIASIEYRTGLRVGRRTIEVVVNHYPDDENFNFYPVHSITSIHTRNYSTGEYELLSNTAYQFLQRSDKMFTLKFADSVPEIDEFKVDCVKITAVVGTDETEALLPMVLGAVRIWVETYFRDKMPAEVKQGVEGFDRCIDNLRLPWL